MTPCSLIPECQCFRGITASIFMLEIGSTFEVQLHTSIKQFFLNTFSLQWGPRRYLAKADNITTTITVEERFLGWLCLCSWEINISFMFTYNKCDFMGAHGSIVGWGTMLQAARSWVRFPVRSQDFFNWPNPSSCTMALGSTQPLTEMSIRNLPWG
jgi:hypothetical protein